MHPEVANYLAWFAPGERAFFDQRITQFRDAAGDYLAIRAGLAHMVPDDNASEEGLAAARKEWTSILRRRGVQFWVLDHVGNQKADLVSRWLLLGSPDEWQLCYLHGRIAIFAWKDPRTRAAPRPSPDPLDLKRVAFGAEAEQAPPRGPEIVLPLHPWWDVWLRAKPPVALDRETAELHAIRFVAMQRRTTNGHSRSWRGAVAAGTLGLALPQGPLPNCLLALELNWSQTYADLLPAEGEQPARPPDRQRDRDRAVRAAGVSEQSGCRAARVSLPGRACRAPRG